MPYFFTSESVSEGHPDKVADQISDAIIDNYLAFDSSARVAVETLVTTGQVILAGEVKTKVALDVQQIARDTINKIGYTEAEYRFDGNSCGVLSAIHEQSADINRGVDKHNDEEQGAGDQGMMFGYANNETENFMPLPIDLAHRIVKELAKLRREDNELTYLRPDAKSQVTVEYSDDHKPLRIDTIVVSTQHDEFIKPMSDSDADYIKAEQTMLNVIKDDIIKELMPRVMAQMPENLQYLFTDKIKYFINPTGKFVIGGPHGDTGLTGRKIIVDTYGGRGAHGGGAFSGKDPSKVDRSAAYAARHLAKNLVAAGVCDEVLVQVSYAIGIAEPVGFYINTYNTNKTTVADNDIPSKIKNIIGFTPAAIKRRLKLENPIYSETAAYGHMGREPRKIKKTFTNPYTNASVTLEVETFTWEKLDLVQDIKDAFDL